MDLVFQGLMNSFTVHQRSFLFQIYYVSRPISIILILQQ